ncbi:MAG: toll/interleukin-1 receptor domain-containing protein [Pirellulaceae bacterium]
MEISFPTDQDGFLSNECPSCERRFKSTPGEGSDQPIACCPYCGHCGEDCWLTAEQVDHIKAVAHSVIIAPELKNLERQLKGIGGGLLKVDVRSSPAPQTPPPIETDDDFDILRFPCCGETIKVKRQDKLFCIICGTEIDLKMSDSKKIFLSHKGVDKQDVKDYKSTLQMLGYDPWIDEDAMPAGTYLERGLLKGMKDSCGVVFFITPSFEDEGYLETEITYAIQEKREKGDKFAIIALQFVGNDGSVGVIPDLLKQFVWKKPKTTLEALREIIRALPVATGAVDWRDEITGVVALPLTKSTTTELSPEALAILEKAASGDGSVFHSINSGGNHIYAGREPMVPDQEPRTVAKWVGGLEDLQRRRYIKDCGHKREVFEVTREGYVALDALRAHKDAT